MNIDGFLKTIIEKGHAETMGYCDVIIDGSKNFNITLKTDEEGVKRLEIVSMPTCY